MSTHLPDVIAPGLAVLFCGINPGLLAAETGHHFAGRSNRFWQVLHRSGFTPTLFAAEEGHRLLEVGCGITAVVRRPTAGAGELGRDEFASAAAPFNAMLRKYKPRYIAFLGKTAYAALTAQRDVAWGRQAVLMQGCIPWVLPNPSGRNRSFTLEALVGAYASLQQAAFP
ncbi:G/U mismatch-specific DNA glycosylase [Luteibacter aegosomatissinici]|uniref:G/U mismatch-specific DNA glycosylase n=1 Tax=Luteibacter aegosomatissinici TaxID=2911539 RepID=UPI001FF79E28|nr:G/U mismatch-specific DNA glycosylase [Luteibacter aegosomatissinici]UPG94583.1 G/U mismatch-specific DNA glycosylase [Luteibacter aegosomatissinici]